MQLWCSAQLGCSAPLLSLGGRGRGLCLQNFLKLTANHSPLGPHLPPHTGPLLDSAVVSGAGRSLLGARAPSNLSLFESAFTLK